MDLMKEKKFGFGCMRLPLKDRTDSTSFDYDRIYKTFDEFLRQGFKYFDTAYTYHRNQSEKIIREVLVERYSREKFQIATKMPLRKFQNDEDLEKIFDEQLKNCGVEYFDFYLLHNIGCNVYEKCCKYGAFEFLERKKAEGKIKVSGMSFHDTPELLDEMLSNYGKYIDFVQLQINYIDWEQKSVQSRRCLEVANKYNKPVTVMEPCKGGNLINIPHEAEEVMKNYNPQASIASWAMRFAASQKGVFRVLSGMNEVDQVVDNAATFNNFKPLNEEEYEIIKKVAKIINSNVTIPCTACEYCIENCPKKIAIPNYFSLYNSFKSKTGGRSSQRIYYRNTILSGHGKASECIKCGKCEQACPQHIKIREYLEEVTKTFEDKNK